MISRKSLCLSGLVTLIFSCAGPDKLGTLDLKAWRNDRGGCNGVRQTLVSNFMAVRDQFKGLHVNDLGKMLGRPDVNEITDRNGKVYVYYIEKGPHCSENTGAKSGAKSVALRVSSIGLVTEVTTQNGTP
ncbi:hypothetical protein [Fibrella forsythiae]|uniref:Lipoprotein SmpA/OmlA domain-containing protein n=1 Tax=Fibrella forsythiae TaxID=2817061 RepID=A0ABS3JK88_9BACT|nr:hypothetical protein [Fibrella forsythiae]MBO0950422.1 hypothetical protein [Fibrella forsythiae]